MFCAFEHTQNRLHTQTHKQRVRTSEESTQEEITIGQTKGSLTVKHRRKTAGEDEARADFFVLKLWECAGKTELKHKESMVTSSGTKQLPCGKRSLTQK